MSASSTIKVLLAPLDWGLGHTTRCIPIIRLLQARGVEVVLAGNEIQKKILSAQFPDCDFLPLEGYNITYARKKQYFVPKILRQLPKLIRAVRKENHWLKEVVAAQGISGVISDNRFGLYHPQIPSVFITHQLHVQTGTGVWADNWVRRINYWLIQKFGECWVPDFEGYSNLAGRLSHPSTMPSVPTFYIGPLTRMRRREAGMTANSLLFILSGPEPQRTIFEDLVFEQLKAGRYNAVVVRGLPAAEKIRAKAGVEVYNHLPEKELERRMADASLIVCRSGYTSLMDLNQMKARAVLIPTPGQAEQEYLADYLTEKGFAVKFDQAAFDLEKIVRAAGACSYRGFIETREDLLEKAVDKFIGDCKAAAHHPL